MFRNPKGERGDLASTPARANRRAPRPDGPLTHFASPCGEKYRLVPPPPKCGSITAKKTTLCLSSYLFRTVTPASFRPICGEDHDGFSHQMCDSTATPIPPNRIELLLGRTCPICCLVAPCQPGVSTLSVLRGVSPRTARTGICSTIVTPKPSRATTLRGWLVSRRIFPRPRSRRICAPMPT